MIVEASQRNQNNLCTCYTVTSRVLSVKQPYGGYLRARDLSKHSLGEGIEALNPTENIHPGLVGLAVDYMTRFIMGTPAKKAFQISLLGALNISMETEAVRLIREIKGLDNQSIINAVKLCGFDVCYRATIMRYVPIDLINPDENTIANIITMVQRAQNFFSIYGPVVKDGLSFEGGYTSTVATGDGDFMTKDTLWEFKTIRSRIDKNHTLQLLMYWRMGIHSRYPEYKSIEYLGIFNPRSNLVYRFPVSRIPYRTIDIIEKDVIGYT